MVAGLIVGVVAGVVATTGTGAGAATAADVLQLAPFYHGILVGETLMRSNRIAETAADLQVSRP